VAQDFEEHQQMERADEQPEFDEEFVELSILELLKRRVNQGPTLSKALWAQLKENPALRLLEFDTVVGRMRYLDGKRWAEWKPVSSGQGVVEHFAAWITAAGEDELRRRAKEKTARQPVEVVAETVPKRPEPKDSGAKGPRCAYLHSLQIAGFTCFESAQLDFQYPGRRAADTEQLESSAGLDNLNLIVGDNGSGKTSVLKAIALTILGGVLPHEGFRSAWQVRRSKLSAKLNAQLQTSDGLEELEQGILNKGPESEILGKWSSSKSTPDGEPSDIWFQMGRSISCVDTASILAGQRATRTMTRAYATSRGDFAISGWPGCLRKATLLSLSPRCSPTFRLAIVGYLRHILKKLGKL
jgi:hypothetical protein